jgi:uncharacterized iron-regulated membrane protein
VSWSKFNARQLWVKIHLWVGLGFGLLLAFVGLSGSLLVFGIWVSRAELGSLTHPQGLPVVEQSQWVPVSLWLEKARQKYPDLGDIEVIAAPGTTPIPSTVPMIAGSVTNTRGPGGGELHAVVSINPSTGEPIGRFIAEETTLVYLTAFHTMLFIPYIGRDLVAYAGLFFVVSLLTGLYLWWPRDGKWRRALSYRRGSTGRMRLLSLHNLAAVWLLVPTFVVTLTGVYILKPHWFDPVLGQLSPLRGLDIDATSRVSAGACNSPTTAAQAIDLARDLAPDQLLRLVSMPHDAAYIQVGLRRSIDSPRAQSTEVWVDARCPKILQARVAGDLSWTEWLASNMLPLHGALGGSLIGSVLVFLIGIVFPVLFVTGFMMWRRRARNRAANHVLSSPSASR